MDGIFAERIRFLREREQLTQNDFAKLLGITQPALSGYEKGRIQPTFEILMKLSTTFHVSIDWLCGLDKSATSLADLISFLQTLDNVNEIKYDIIIDKTNNKASIQFDANDPEHSSNSNVLTMLESFMFDREDFLSYSSTKKTFDWQAQNIIDDYSKCVLTPKQYPELSHEERLEKRLEYLNKKAWK